MRLALWGFEVGADGERYARGPPPQAFRRDGAATIALNTVSTLRFGCRCRLMVQHSESGLNAGDKPARSIGNGAVQEWRHEVSILITGDLGTGLYFGSAPRSNVSMMSMRPPQQGHGRERTLGSSPPLLSGSGSFWGAGTVSN